MLDPDLKRLLTILKWETSRKFKSLGLGGLSPTNRGRGLEFKEVRPYNFGDDTRYIDWNVTSRTGDLYVKEFYSEQDVPVIICIDCSKSMDGAKSQTAFQLAFFLTLLHIKMGNRVRLVLFANDVFQSGRILQREQDAFVEFKKVLENKKNIDTKGTAYVSTLSTLSKISPKFTVCYWLSDFCYFEGFGNFKSLLNRWEHYGIWIEEQDAEIELPFWFRIFKFIDSEFQNSVTRNSRLKIDQQNFQNTFHNKTVVIRPELKLSNQILALFIGKSK
ncbi:MAG: DUF58 domain-containing protein [Leptospira sp.]|nr:DUF58 domain-containing protein [Leptospira sp.]